MRNETSGYHIFFEPQGLLRETLSADIHTLAKQYGGPVFPPHVTLLGSILEHTEEQVITIATMLAREYAPLTLTLGEITGEDAYFRAFYIRVKESPMLSSYYERACEAFGMVVRPYTPHISLFYGSVVDAQRSDMAGSLSYVSGSYFTADALSVYRGEGGAEDWQQIAHISFK